MPNRPPGRPRSFDRSAALETAMEAFWRRGYEGVPLSELTRLLGVNSPSLYAAFRSKEGLFREALDLYVSTHGSFASRALAEEPAARDAMQRLLLDAAVAYSTPGKPRGCLLVAGAATCAPGNEAIVRRVRERRIEGTSAIRARLERARADGELPRGADPAILATYFAAVVQGIAQQARDGAPREALLGVARAAMGVWPAERRRSSTDRVHPRGSSTEAPRNRRRPR